MSNNWSVYLSYEGESGRGQVSKKFTCFATTLRRIFHLPFIEHEQLRQRF